ncbi:hypothetical protein EX30DRAFT_350483 [Ascodesmis nigricans]|uniref:BZIP domain-containing protein n=1 Tax=Ascodesmis nigricans TaxID=341454 RepID=A0A4S2MQ06_9PEZI|nr:hypothetical protein EX30DRAFT_350483 [Ascodesmis nigricans]
MAAVKTSPPRSTTSPASSPEAAVAEQAAAPAVQQPVQKRKGGRKPVYATQEERKMRNRAAQAAFRERRTEYIKHLENTIKQHEEQLSGLQQTSRLAADEVLMLRYKNSLLERILLEKGIDVAAELRTYTGAPQQLPPRPQPLGPPPQTQPLSHQQISHPPPLSQTGSLHRPALNRRPSQQQHKALLGRQDGLFIKASPDPLRAPNPNMSSPSIPTPPSSTAFSFPPRAQDITQPPSTGPQSYYPSPYQTHMEELGKLPRVLPILLTV